MKIENITPKEIKVIPFKEKVVVPPMKWEKELAGGFVCG